MSSKAITQIKAFGMTNQMVTEDLSRIADSFAIDLGHIINSVTNVEEVYLPQFDARLRAEASRMRKNYEIIYCLENTIRSLVSSTFEMETDKTEWWDSVKIHPTIRQEVTNRINKERDDGISPRSTDQLAYTTFGELSIIVQDNWDFFGGIFNSKKAFSQVMGKLNSLRATIAHCCPLAEDEELRLQLSIRDWFRLTE